MLCYTVSGGWKSLNDEDLKGVEWTGCRWQDIEIDPVFNLYQSADGEPEFMLQTTEEESTFFCENIAALIELAPKIRNLSEFCGNAKLMETVK